MNKNQFNETCPECINFKDGMCMVKKPGYCLNYDHFQWSPMIQISPRDLEEKYVSRLMFDEMKARVEKRTAEVERLLSMVEVLKNTIVKQREECEALKKEIEDRMVFIQFEYEDELPADIPEDVYSAMFECSHVDVVRLFPYIEENGQKYFLVLLKESQ